MKRFLIAFVLIANAGLLQADDWYAKAVKSVTMAVTPAEALPGEVVSVKIAVSLNDTYHTYPTVQQDRKAADQVNSITFPAGDAAGLIFVGKVIEPLNPTKKAEPVLGIREMHIFSGVATFERKAIVSPKAKAGEQTVKLPKFVLLVCDDSNCYPPKTLALDATWKVKAGVPVVIPAEHKEAVEAVVGK